MEESRIMNQNSLDNLRGEKEKKEGYGYRYQIPLDKIDEIFSYLADGKSLKQSAKEANVCFATVKKYFEQGDPKRGIKPLQTRLVIFQERVSEKMNVLLEEQRMERIQTVRALIKKAEEKMLGIFDAEGEIIKEGDLSKVSIRDLERLIKLETFLCGTVRTKDTDRKLLTADEIGGGG